MKIDLNGKKPFVLVAGLVALVLSLGAAALFIKQRYKHNPSIGIVCISTPNRMPFARFTLPSLKKYADQCGYDIQFLDKTLDPTRHVAWSKIKAVLNLLEKGKHDWVVWFDDDIFITNPNFKLDECIKKFGKDAHLIIGGQTADASVLHDLNSGMFLVKNSAWSRKFLQRVWDAGNGTEFLHHTPWEQALMIKELDSEDLRGSPYVAKLPGRILQSFIELQLKEDVKDYSQWQPGDFAAHMPGAANEARIVFFGQLARSCSFYPVIPLGWRKMFTVKSSFDQKNTEKLLYPSIGLVTISTDDRQSFSKHAFARFKLYAEYWGYDLHIKDVTTDASSSMHASKIKAALDLLKTDKYEWVVWFEDDVFITDANLPLNPFINEYGQKAHFIISARSVNSLTPNEADTGVFFVKNSPWAKNFLQRALEMNCSNEQEAIVALMSAKEFAGSVFINRVPVCNIQSFEPENKDGYGQWKPGDFSWNLAGQSRLYKILVMQQLARDSYIYPRMPTFLKNSGGK